MRVCLCVVAVLCIAGLPATGSPADAETELVVDVAPECTITFDDVCPDTQRVCRTGFRGGAGCVVEGLPFCYDSGMFAYKVEAGDRLRIRFGVPLSEVELFFAQGGAGSRGRIDFFDENGLQVGAPLGTNGDCSLAMPTTQTVTFDRPVVGARVRAFDVDVFIDSLRVVAY